MDKSLFNLPEDPVRNLDFEAHGRKTAAEACVVTVAIFPGLKIGWNRTKFSVTCSGFRSNVCAWLRYISFQNQICGSCFVLQVDGWFAWFLWSSGGDLAVCFQVANGSNCSLILLSLVLYAQIYFFFAVGWEKMLWGLHFSTCNKILELDMKLEYLAM